jgi:hypothetical protein
MCSKARGLRMLRGAGRHKSRGGAPRGERPTSLDARRLAKARSRASFVRKAPAGVRYSPAVGCRSTRAPVGAPPPHFV